MKLLMLLSLVMLSGCGTYINKKMDAVQNCTAQGKVPKPVFSPLGITYHVECVDRVAAVNL